MSVIKGLLKKDLLNLASYKQSLLKIIAFLAIFSAFNKGMIQFLPIAVSTAMGMIVLSTFNYDEIAKADNFILSFPTNRKEVVKEKYILVVSSMILGGIIGVILTILVNYIMMNINPEFQVVIDYHSLLVTTLSGMFGITLVEAIQIPSIYKWGAEKGRVQMFILIFLIVAIITGAVFLFSHFNIGLSLDSLNTFLSNYGLIILIITTIFMLYISYKISCKIYCKKSD